LGEAEQDEWMSRSQEVISVIRAAFLGALFAIIGAFPVAALVALVYRFPIPSVGYSSGFDAIVPSLYAVFLYGIVLGGFVVLAVGGAIGGVIAYSVQRPKEKSVGRLCLGFALVVDVVAVLVMAILDKLIGPW
jgi:uncharacterized membrane protein YfcA